MDFKRIILVTILLLLLITPVLAAGTNVTASRGVTAKGPYGLLVALGIEQVIPLSSALMFYNWIAIALLFFAMSMASQRNMRFFVIIVPLMAAMFGYFGWLNDASNPAKVWGIIITSGLLGAAIYMKDTNKEKWGSGGPGLTLLNFVFYIILLQSCVGVINTSAIWEHNTAVTPSQYQNVDLSAQMTGISNTGGLMGDAISTAVALIEVGIMVLKMILSIIASIAAFSVVLVLIFPWLSGSTLVLAVLGAAQVIVWLLYAWFFFQIIYKPMPDGGYI
jgi:hypothetical protein